MALTVNELADDLGVAPADIRVLMSQYSGDVPMWEESGVLAPEMCHDVSVMLSTNSRRHVSEQSDYGD